MLSSNVRPATLNSRTISANYIVHRTTGYIGTAVTYCLANIFNKWNASQRPFHLARNAFGMWVLWWTGGVCSVWCVKCTACKFIQTMFGSKVFHMPYARPNNLSKIITVTQCTVTILCIYAAMHFLLIHRDCMMHKLHSNYRVDAYAYGSGCSWNVNRFNLNCYQLAH